MVGDSHARCSKLQHGRVDRTTWLGLSVGFAAIEGIDGVRGGRTGVDDEDWLAMRRSVTGLVDLKPAVVAIWIGGNAMTKKPAAPSPTASPVVAHQEAAERGSKVAAHVSRFIAFVREVLPDVVPLILGPVPPHLADEHAVAACRSMAELLRVTAKNNLALFLDVEAELRAHYATESARQSPICIPSAWVAGGVAGKPPPVQRDAPKLPEHAYTEDNVHISKRGYQTLCREISRILESLIVSAAVQPK